jgi:hypothetical protein
MKLQNRILVPELTVEQGIFHGFGAYIAVGRK